MRLLSWVHEDSQETMPVPEDYIGSTLCFSRVMTRTP